MELPGKKQRIHAQATRVWNLDRDGLKPRALDVRLPPSVYRLRR